MRFALQVGGEKQDRAIYMLPAGPERRRLDQKHTRYVSASISMSYTPASADATVSPARIPLRRLSSTMAVSRIQEGLTQDVVKLVHNTFGRFLFWW